jgi:hypothetical protein
MPVNDNYELPPSEDCTQRKKIEIHTVATTILAEVDADILGGTSEEHPFNWSVAYHRHGCGCGEDHLVTYELACVQAGTFAEFGLEQGVYKIRRLDDPTLLTFLMPSMRVVVTAIRFSQPNA